MAEIRLDNVSRLYGDKPAVDRLMLHIHDGEFISLLGPSGCGKSTTLALIAGLDQPTSGQITIGNDVVARAGDRLMVLPEHRGLGLVPQSYALWPHMTVAQNVGFPLKVRRIPRADRDRRVAEVLGLVEMSHLGARYPHELSGGQQQRVAVARTLVYRPRVLLLDEPLSNLDTKLRERARQWLHALQRELKITTVFVTHDQSEALSLSDRIAVLDAGKLMQFGTPAEVYRRPASAFVADFVGDCSFLDGTVTGERDGEAEVRIGDAGVLVLTGPRGLARGTEVSLAVRPEALRPVPAAWAGPSLIKCTVASVEFTGRWYRHHALAAGQALRFEADTPLSGEVMLACETGGIVSFPRSGSLH